MEGRRENENESQVPLPGTLCGQEYKCSEMDLWLPMAPHNFHASRDRSISVSSRLA